MAVLPRPVTMMMLVMPEWMASSTPYWMMGLSTSGNISLGWALVAGRKRVPRPAAGKTALRTFATGMPFYPGTRVILKHQVRDPDVTFAEQIPPGDWPNNLNGCAA